MISCQVEDYRNLFTKEARPTAKQVDQFILYFCGVQSWFKQLPLIPPGEAFTFYVDPFAGYDWRVNNHGQWIYQMRGERQEEAYYPWMTTLDYRQRMGTLSFGSGLAHVNVVGCENRAYVHEVSGRVTVEQDKLCALPAEVLKIGTVRLSSVIHRETPTVPKDWVSEVLDLDEQFPDYCPWPEASGGVAAWYELLEFCRRNDPQETTPGVRRLLDREAERQIGEIRSAIGRMLDFVFAV